MKLVMTLLTRDDGDVLESHLAYHLNRGVDLVLVTDNGSTDATPEILEDFRRAGHIKLIGSTPPEGAWREFQYRVVTAMARSAATEHGADWVINGDTDEFLWPRRGSLKDILSAVPRHWGALRMPSASFVLRPDDGRFFADRLVHRETLSVSHSGRPIAKVVHRASPEVHVSRGNHRAHGPGLDVVPGWEPVDILHFPYRGYEQFARKMLQFKLRVEPAWERREREALSAGGIEEVYRRWVYDDERISRELREGRLVRDERVRAFFAAREGKSPLEMSDSGADTVVPDAELREEQARATWLAQNRPPSDEERTLQRKFEACKRELEMLRGSRWWRLGHRLRRP